MKSVTTGLIFVGCLLATGTASAHFSLDFPKGRSVEIDNSPCGGKGSMRGGPVTVFHPGDTVTLQWNVMVQHTTPGLWRISIDDSGQDFPDPVGANDTSKLPFFMDHVEATGVMEQELQITLPNIECQNCTLQMLQYKLDKPPYTDPSSFYYQCADIIIDPNAVVTPPGTTAGGSSQSGSSSGGSMTPAGGTAGGTPAGTAGGTESAGKAATSASPGGCSISARRVATGTNNAWFALALLLVGRRRRQSAAPVLPAHVAI